jgi:hypothetical protein
VELAELAAEYEQKGKGEGSRDGQKQQLYRAHTPDGVSERDEDYSDGRDVALELRELGPPEQSEDARQRPPVLHVVDTSRLTVGWEDSGKKRRVVHSAATCTEESTPPCRHPTACDRGVDSDRTAAMPERGKWGQLTQRWCLPTSGIRSEREERLATRAALPATRGPELRGSRVESMESFVIVTSSKAHRGFPSSSQNPSSQDACVKSLSTAFEVPRFVPRQQMEGMC